MNLSNFFDRHTKEEREAKLKHACNKLIYAINKGEPEYIAKRIAYINFISNQFVDKYNWAELIYKFYHQLEEELLFKKKIKEE